MTAATISPMTRVKELITLEMMSKAIHAVTQLGIVDEIAVGAKSCNEIAMATGTHAPSLYRVLRVLSSFGIFSESPDGHFQMTPMAHALTNGEKTLRSFALMFASPWNQGPFGELVYALKTGESAFEKSMGMPLFDYLDSNPGAAQLFNSVMTDFLAPVHAAAIKIDATSLSLRARHVVLATGPFQQPKFPDVYRNTSSQVFHLHSSQYRNPQQLPPGDVLVVGSGNSGVQIAVELARQSNVFLSRERDVAIPRRISGQGFVSILPKFGINDCRVADQDRDTVADFMWWMDKFGLYEMSIHTPLGQILGKDSDPYIGEPPMSVAKSTGIVLMDKVTDMHSDTVIFADGQKLKPRSVIWCTGYQHDYSWVHAPAFDDRSAPFQERGVTRVPGLYVLGLRWMHMADSGLLRGVCRDASYLTSQIVVAMKKSA